MLDLIVIGASAGGVTALRDLVRLLPADLPAAVLAVVHLSPIRKSGLAEILNHSGTLPASEVVGGEQILPGCVVVGAPDHHMIVDGEVLRCTRGPKHNGYRPSVDVLFRSAAESFGPAVTGIILSGMMTDGANGLAAIKEAGGRTIVQHPNEAPSAEMPLNALRQVEVDHCAPVAEIAAIIGAGVSKPGKGRRSMRAPERALGPTGFRCPDCGGPLQEFLSGEPYRCIVGHAFSEEGLRTGYAAAVENAVYGAVCRLFEHAAFLRKLASEAEHSGDHIRTALLEQAARADEHARVIKDLVESERP